MQTFLSEDTFHESAQVLDNKRLQKLYLEGWQILDAIRKTPEGGRQKVSGKYVFAANHPVTNQWRGHEYMLMSYLQACCDVLDARGIKTDVVTAKIAATFEGTGWETQYGSGNYAPEWLTDPYASARLRTTHRGNLFNKDPEHYAQYEASAVALDKHPDSLVCCPGKHAPYYYPTH